MGPTAAVPRRRLAIVACMDARLDIAALFGIDQGDAHVISNAGGIITDDAIRSLMLSQRFLGTREIILLHHTDCGLSSADEAMLRAELEDEVGITPCWALGAFDDPCADVQQSIRRLRLSPFVAHDQHIRGFVYDVDTGRLVEATVE